MTKPIRNLRMLIQCFAQGREDVMSAVTMINKHFTDRKQYIDKFRIELWKDIREGFYDFMVESSVLRALQTIDQHSNFDYDNVGVYYNDGETIFIKIYKNAKHDFSAYRHDDEPNTMTDASNN